MLDIEDFLLVSKIPTCKRRLMKDLQFPHLFFFSPCKRYDVLTDGYLKLESEWKMMLGERFLSNVIHVLQMIIETVVKKQGNSNVIILPKKLGLKPADKVKVLVIDDKVAQVQDIAGMFKRKLARVDTDKLLKNVKKDLWGE